MKETRGERSRESEREEEIEARKTECVREVQRRERKTVERGRESREWRSDRTTMDEAREQEQRRRDGQRERWMRMGPGRGIKEK